LKTTSRWRTSVPGLATVLDVDPVRLRYLFIESTRFREAEADFDGQLGRRHEESAQAASLSLVKAERFTLGIDPNTIQTNKSIAATLTYTCRPRYS